MKRNDGHCIVNYCSDDDSDDGTKLKESQEDRGTADRRNI